MTFDLPTFQETVTNLTTFVTDTSNLGPFTAVSLSGNSTDCSLPNAAPAGPCFIGEFASGGGIGLPAFPSFSGPGMFTVTATEGVFVETTTVTITDVPGVPEPSSLLLLGCGLFGLLAMASFGSRFRRFAS